MLFDLISVDKRTVGTSQVNQLPTAVGTGDLGVSFGDVIFGQSQVVDRYTTNRKFGFVCLDFLAISAFFLNDYAQHQRFFPFSSHQHQMRDMVDTICPSFYSIYTCKSKFREEIEALFWCFSPKT